MNAAEIHYQCEQERKQLLNVVAGLKARGLMLSPSECLVEAITAIYSVGGEIAAQLADTKEVTMQQNGIIRVPDAIRIRPTLGQLGGELRCTTCGKIEELSSEAIEAYVVDGWPSCCGLVMLWTTRKEMEEIAARRARQEGQYL